MTDANDLQTSWQRFADWFAAHTPVTFRAGRADADGPLSSLFLLVDGQVGTAAVFDGGFSLLSLDDARGEKAMLDTLARDEQWPSSWWSPTWFPFASDGCGQVLVVDGDTGSVIEFIHDDEDRPVLAPSLVEFLVERAEELEQGRQVFDAHIGVVDAGHAARRQQRQEARAAQEAVYAGRARWFPLVALGVALVFALVWALTQH
jgi:hypothetical protein